MTKKFHRICIDIVLCRKLCSPTIPFPLLTKNKVNNCHFVFLDIGIPFDENGDGDIDSDDENPQGRRKQSKNLRPKSARKSGAPNTPPIRGEVDPGPSPGPTQQSEPRTRKDSIHSSCELFYKGKFFFQKNLQRPQSIDYIF